MFQVMYEIVYCKIMHFSSLQCDFATLLSFISEFYVICLSLGNKYINKKNTVNLFILMD